MTNNLTYFSSNLFFSNFIQNNCNKQITGQTSCTSSILALILCMFLKKIKKLKIVYIFLK